MVVLFGQGSASVLFFPRGSQRNFISGLLVCSTSPRRSLRSGVVRHGHTEYLFILTLFSFGCQAFFRYFFQIQNKVVILFENHRSNPVPFLKMKAVRFDQDLILFESAIL